MSTDRDNAQFFAEHGDDILLTLVRNHSEDLWAATWYSGIELKLWDQRDNPSDGDAERIVKFAQFLGRWPIWRDTDDATCIPIDEFAVLADTARDDRGGWKP